MYEHAQQVPVQQTNKLLGLEVIRFIAALSVLVWHYQHFFYIANSPADFTRENQPFYSFLSLFYNYGYYGVQVFWCISGFIFFWKYRSTIAGNYMSAKKFFNLRFSRLYPLHFVTLLLILLLQTIYFSQKNYFFVYQNNDITHFALQLFFASNWGFEKGASFNGPIWSISVEVLVYFFFFLSLRYIGKSPLLNIGILFLCSAANFFKVATPVVDCVAFFYLGGISAIAFQHFEKSKYKTLLNVIAASFVVTAPIVACTTQIYQLKYFHLLFLLLYIPMLLYVSANHIKATPIIQKAIESAGNMTYSSYLIHFPIQLLFALYFLNVNRAIPYYDNLFFSAFVLATLIASYFIYHLFELPIQNFIRNKTKATITRTPTMRDSDTLN